MTAKERVLKEAPNRSEANGVAVLRVVDSREELKRWLENERPEDLDTWGNATSQRTFDHLDEEEAAIGFSWENYR